MSQSNAYGNRREGKGFTNVRKNKIISDYKKIKAKEHRRQGFDKTKTELQTKQKVKRKNTYAKAQKIAEEKKQELAQQREQQQREREEKEKQRKEAIAQSKQKRKNRQKALCKKNWKGQPYLANQMHMLLEKIQSNQADDSRPSTAT